MAHRMQHNRRVVATKIGSLYHLGKYQYSDGDRGAECQCEHSGHGFGARTLMSSLLYTSTVRHLGGRQRAACSVIPAMYTGREHRSP